MLAAGYYAVRDASNETDALCRECFGVKYLPNLASVNDSKMRSVLHVERPSRQTCVVQGVTSLKTAPSSTCTCTVGLLGDQRIGCR